MIWVRCCAKLRKFEKQKKNREIWSVCWRTTEHYCTQIANKVKRSWVPHWNCCNGRHQMVCLTRDSRSCWNLKKNLLPEGYTLPETTYEAKKVVCPLGLEAQKIYACPNDCILYRGEEYENLDSCPVCNACRYKIPRDDPGDVEGMRFKKRVPAKVMWYFPLIPCLKHLFMNEMNAKLMR